MNTTDQNMLWRISAVLLGMALPCILLLKPGLTYGLLAVGLVTGLAATQGESLRGSVRLLLDSKLVALVLVFLGAALVSTAVGFNPAYAFDKWLQLLLAAVVAGGMFIALREMPTVYLELLLKALAITTFCMIGIALADVAFNEPRLSIFIHGEDKYIGEYRLNFFSSALAVILPFVWARLFIKSREGEPFARKVAVPAAAISLLALILCGGRAGWVGGMAGVAVFLCMAGRYHKLVIHARHWVYVAGVVVMGLLAYAAAYGPDFVLRRLMIQPEQGRGLMSGRGEVWRSAWENIGHSWAGWLFGVGPMNFRNLPGTVDLHPHNWVLQSLLELGLVGTAAYVAMVGYVLYTFIHYAKGNVYGVAALASLTAFLITGLANTSMFNMWWVTFMVLTCLLGWRAGWSGDGQHRRRRGRMVVRQSIVGEK